MSRTARHVIFGTGAIGLATWKPLPAAVETVQLVEGPGSASVPEEMEW